MCKSCVGFVGNTLGLVCSNNGLIPCVVIKTFSVCKKLVHCALEPGVFSPHFYVCNYVSSTPLSQWFYPVSTPLTIKAIIYIN